MEPTPNPAITATAARGDAPQRRRLASRIARRLDWIFVVAVLLPTLAALVYYGLIASDVYISESRFVVKTPEHQGTSPLGALLQTTGLSRSQDDTYSVHDYVLSRDALHELDSALGVRKLYSAPTIDAFDRFTGMQFDDSFEAFYRYYRKRVSIEYDTVSSISVLYVQAYTAQDAQRINDLLLKVAEQLVNNLNERSRQDLIQTAQREVSTAEERSKTAAVALSAYRSGQAVFDPERQSALQLQGVAKTQEELLAAEVELSQMRQLAPNNASIAALKSRVDTLRASVNEQSAKVTSDRGSLVSKTSNYDRLVLEKTFADRQLATSLASLETARNEAQRKQLYLERLVQPNLPDAALEPKRLRSILTVFVLGLICWGVLSLVMASVREHRDN